jgi:hypothetical protein
VSWFRSWINRKSPMEVDAATAGGLPLYLFFEKKDPFAYVFNEEIFAAWTGERTIPDHSKPILGAVAISSQLLIFLRLLEEKFGHEITRLLREHLMIVADRAPELQISELLRALEEAIQRATHMEDSPGGEPIWRRIALAALVTIPVSPYFLSQEKRTPEQLPQAFATGGYCWGLS